jgi:hypothetical protein
LVTLLNETLVVPVGAAELPVFLSLSLPVDAVFTVQPDASPRLVGWPVKVDEPLVKPAGVLHAPLAVVQIWKSADWSTVEDGNTKLKAYVVEAEATDEPRVRVRVVATPAEAPPTLKSKKLKLSKLESARDNVNFILFFIFDSILSPHMIFYVDCLLLYISTMKYVKQITTVWKPLFSLVLLLGFLGVKTVNAAPYGTGKYGDNVPYGSETSLAISTSGNVNIQVTPTEAGTLATAANTVTVTSTDVVGYKLYIRSLTSTNMVNGASTIPASANGSPASLAVNTWGYNTDASSNFVGSTLVDTLIKNAVGPYSSGDDTTVTYGVKVDNNKAAGNYVTTVVYTAVPQTD